MNATNENSQATAYLFGECNVAEAAAFEREMSRDTALAAEVAELRQMCSLLKESFGTERLTLGVERIEQIKKSAYRPDSELILLSDHRRSRWQTLGVLLASAAAVALGFFVLNNAQTDRRLIGRTDAPSSSTPRIAAQNGIFTDDGTDSSVTKIPRVESSASLVEMEKILINERRLPHADEVNLRELLAYPNYEISPQMKAGDVSVMAEVGSCPWRDDAVLAGIWLNADEEQHLFLEMMINKDAVKSSRVLARDDSMNQSLKSELIFQGRHCVFMEIVPVDRSKTDELFSLAMSVLNKRGAADEGFLAVKNSTNHWDECSKSWRTATLLASFEKNLSGDKSEGIALNNLSEKATSLSSEIDDNRARYALDLISLAAELEL